MVTGGAGYIGSHVCKALAQENYLPVTLDDLSLGNRWAVKWGPLFEGSCGDPSLLERLFTQFSFCGLIHLAALSSVRESFENPLAYYQTNVAHSVALLHCAKRWEVPLVYSSSCAVYGTPQKLPIGEEHPKAPISPYGRSKWMTEQMIGEAGVKSICLRYFNAAGADLEGEIGERRRKESHLIPLLIEAAQGKRERVLLYGETHPTPDGTPVRDFIHVSDLAQAHVKALQKLEQKEGSIALNLGTERGYSVREVIEAIERRWKRKIPLKVADKREGDPPSLIAQAQKTRTYLEWEPRLSTLSTILESAWEWHTQA